MISIFTPSHRPDYLPEVYRSLCAQTVKTWEWVILLNNGAVWSCEDPRVRIYQEPTGSSSVGFLKKTACGLATGDILLELDHDDELFQTALEEVLKAFEEDGVDFVYSNCCNHDVRTNLPITYEQKYGWTFRPCEYRGIQTLEAVGASPNPQSISRIWYAPNHLRAWKKHFYERIGGHDLSLKVADDHDLICRTYIHGTMRHIDKPLYFYRVSGANTWLANVDTIQSEQWRIHDKYFSDMMWRWSKDYSLRCLQLGGVACEAGVEIVGCPKGDIVADLNNDWPFADDSVGMIRCYDVLCKFRNPIHWMNEAWRVLAHGGFLDVLVPSTSGIGGFANPTSKSFWNARSFRYYTEAKMRSQIESDGCQCRFQPIKIIEFPHIDGMPYVQAHLIAIKQDAPRFAGELTI